MSISLFSASRKLRNAVSDGTYENGTCIFVNSVYSTNIVFP